MYKIEYILNVYSILSLDICTQCCHHYYQVSKSPCVAFACVHVFVYVCGKDT